MCVEKINLSLIGMIYFPKAKVYRIEVFNEISIKKICDFIDWKPFFNHGNYMETFLKYLTMRKLEKLQKILYGDALNMLEDMVKKN